VIGIGRLVKPWYVWRPWQLVRRAQIEWKVPRADYRPLPVAWGVSLLADPRMAIGRSIQTAGVHDLAVTEVLARLVQAGDTVVDAGAHIGYMATLAALAAGPDGHVMAWEPHPELFVVLERNVAGVATRRRMARMTLRNAALGSTPGLANLVIPDEGARNDGTSHLERTASPPTRSIPVKVETIDDVLEAEGAESVDVMKLDVEGSELHVLCGATQALRAGRIRHIVFEDHQGPTSDVVRLLESIGYATFAIGWSIRGPKLGPLSGGTLAAEYEAPSYLATLAPDEVHGRCSKAGWLTLSARFAKSITRSSERRERSSRRATFWRR
jgi:FkbM family methyltransferase